MKRLLILAVCAAFALALSAPQPVRAIPVAVDLELALLVDVSGSISDTEFTLQRTGYVNAFNNPDLVSAIQAGAIGSIAATLVYWDGAASQRQAVAWMEIDDAASASAFATAIGAATRPFGGSSALTAIGEALDFGSALFGPNDFVGTRQVIDISGDGINNDGISPSEGRAIALAAGVDTINGLVIGTSQAVLDEYTNDVIGGANAFVVHVDDFADFGDAIDDKIIREVTIPDASTLFLLGSASLIGFWRSRRKS